MGLAAMLASCGTPDAEAPAGDAPTFVSLNPCLDAIIAEVAAPELVLALSHYSRDPAASSMDVELAARFGVTGGTAEEVIALQPDIVLAGSFIAPATRAALEAAGLRVETFGSPNNAAESIEQIERLAALTGEPQRATHLIAMIAQDPPQSEHAFAALLWQPGEIVAGANSLVHEHMQWAGLSSQSEALGLGQADRVSIERILSNPPEILLIAGDGPGQRHPALQELEGTYVASFEPSLFYCAGPSIPAARARLTSIVEEAARELGQ